jgi:hypothetical protein
VTTALDHFARQRLRASALLDDLADVMETLGTGTDTSRPEHLRVAARRAREGRFVVLLLGCFSSGKSTLLNALLGQSVLPVKVNPCTAILTEVVYGDTPRVEVHYRDGRVESQDVDTFVETFQLRTQSHSEAGSEASDRFGDITRAVVSWPLPVLRNGVVLLDTPGLDDDPIRTARTLSSLPDADAVIVVLSANRFLTDLERKTLRRNLLPLGLTNLFFPVTMVDLLDALSDTPEQDLQDMTQRARDILGPLCDVKGTDLFEQRFFPLDARGALRARSRKRVVKKAVAATGILEFEAALSRFLIHDRGRAQLSHLHRTAERMREEVCRQAEVDKATASASVEELQARAEALIPRFDELQVIARRVGRTADAFIQRQKAIVWQDLRDFMAETEADLPEAIATFDLGGLASLDLLTPRGRARVESQLRSELETWLEDRVAQWQGSLRPQIERALWDLRTELAADAADFDAVASTIVTDFAGSSIQVPRVAEGTPEVDAVERWFSVAVGAVLLSPGAMAAGWTEGYEGAMKGAASRLGVRIALLTLGALLGPIGWVGLVIYLLSDAVLLAVTGGGQLKRLRDKVAEKLQGQLVHQADAARPEIETQVAEGLAPLREALVQAAEVEASELRGLLDRTIAARAKAVRDATSRAEAWATALQTFDEKIHELASLREEAVASVAK